MKQPTLQDVERLIQNWIEPTDENFRDLIRTLPEYSAVAVMTLERIKELIDGVTQEAFEARQARDEMKTEVERLQVVEFDLRAEKEKLRRELRDTAQYLESATNLMEEDGADEDDVRESRERIEAARAAIVRHSHKSTGDIAIMPVFTEGKTVELDHYIITVVGEGDEMSVDVEYKRRPWNLDEKSIVEMFFLEFLRQQPKQPLPPSDDRQRSYTEAQIEMLNLYIDQQMADKIGLKSELKRLREERCTCDEGTGRHEPYCPVVREEIMRGMEQEIAALRADHQNVVDVSWRDRAKTLEEEKKKLQDEVKRLKNVAREQDHEIARLRGAEGDLRAIRITLGHVQDAFHDDEPDRLATINESVQSVVDEAINWGRRLRDRAKAAAEHQFNGITVKASGGVVGKLTSLELGEKRPEKIREIEATGWSGPDKRHHRADIMMRRARAAREENEKLRALLREAEPLLPYGTEPPLLRGRILEAIGLEHCSDVEQQLAIWLLAGPRSSR